MLLRQLSIFAACLIGGAALGSYGGSLSGSLPGSGSGNTRSASSVPLSYSRKAQLGVAGLQSWYFPGSGLYASPTGWWNAANSITVLANYAKVTSDTTYDFAIANTFAAAQKLHANFLNSYYDDDGWWALAWIQAYDLTGDTTYLSMAETIFSTIATNGWDNAVCGGGVWWNTSRTYKNAIPNELFLDIAAKLANRTTGSASVTYLNWAKKEWAWFKASGMINTQNLVNDGLTSTNRTACRNNGGATWTYNQGVILGGLVELYRADNDPTLLPQAEAIANAAIAHLSSNGILIEAGKISGGDAPQFKGVFMRNLMALYTAVSGAQAEQYKHFVDDNANSIWANDRGPSNEFGGYWQGPFDSADATRQTSALDALIAAAAMQ